MAGPTLPIVNAVTMVKLQGRPNILIQVNQALYYDEPLQDESLILPYQAMEHGVLLDLVDKESKKTDGSIGTQQMIVDEVSIPLEFDGRKNVSKHRKTK